MLQVFLETVTRVIVSTTKDSCLSSWNGKILLHMDPQLKLIAKQLYEALKTSDNKASVGPENVKNRPNNEGKTTYCPCSGFAILEKIHLILLNIKDR